MGVSIMKHRDSRQAFQYSRQYPSPQKVLIAATNFEQLMLLKGNGSSFKAALKEDLKNLPFVV